MGHWAKGEECLEFIKNNPVDVIIMDYKLPGMNGVETTAVVKTISPQTQVVVLSMFSDEEEVFGAIQAGALGYLPKEVTTEELVEGIRQVHRGYAVLDPRIARKVLGRFAPLKTADDKEKHLTLDEKKMLKLIGKGLSYDQMAEKMKTNTGVIKNRVKDIFRKLNVRDKAQAVYVAIKRGYISPD